MKNNLRFALVAIVSIMCLLQGCSVILSSKYQKVEVKTATPAASIVFEKDTVGKGNATVKLNKYKGFHNVDVAKDGYKTYHHPIPLDKFSPSIAFLAIDYAGIIIGASVLKASAGKAGAGAFLLTGYALKNPKLRRFSKLQTVPALIPLAKRNADEKYLLIDKTAIEAKSENIRLLTYSSLSKFNKHNIKDAKTLADKSGKQLSKKDYKVENTVFTNGLNWTLKRMNFLDTTGSIFPNAANSMYIEATVKKLNFHLVWNRYYPLFGKAGASNSLLCVEMEVQWVLYDFYKQKLFTTTTTKKSDLFVMEGDEENETNDVTIYRAIRDNFEYSIMDVRKQLADKGLLKTSTDEVKKLDDISIAKPAPVTSSKIEDRYRSSVAIKVDSGNGSGAIISDDGYIITSYVVAGSKKIEIIFNDSSSATADVIRKNIDADVALLKVNKTGLVPFIFSSDKDPDIGGDVWAMGAPKGIELGQSVSKGILSGIRKTNGITMLQTDAVINSGNSGGALLNQGGEVIGIISSKLTGYGAEGIGFGIIAYQVFEKLGLKYK